MEECGTASSLSTEKDHLLRDWNADYDHEIDRMCNT